MTRKLILLNLRILESYRRPISCLEYRSASKRRAAVVASILRERSPGMSILLWIQSFIGFDWLSCDERRTVGER